MVTFFEDRMVIRIMNENQSNTESFYLPSQKTMDSAHG
jgi:hypothetical protein